MEEIRKDVVGYKWFYKVSSLGRVMWLINQQKQYRERILKPWTATGYCYLNLCKHGKQKTAKVHRLVAEAFLPNPQNKRCVNHINWIKTDNRVENLEWATHSENRFHAKRVLWHTYFKGNRDVEWVSNKYCKQLIFVLKKPSKDLSLIKKIEGVVKPEVEEFKAVLWYEWLYIVSNLWRVFSTIYWYDKELKWGNSRWYARLKLYWLSWIKSCSVHRLVAEAFIPNPDNLPIVNHINGIKDDNHVNNLERCTHEENMQHSFRTKKQNNWKSMLWRFHWNHNTARRVNQYTLDWEFIRERSCIKEAKDNIWKINISRACQWKVKSAWWFLRSYAD